MVKSYKSSKKLGKPIPSYKSWSPFRPIKRDVMLDSGVMDELAGLATKAHEKATYWAVADSSGLCQSTISRLANQSPEDAKISTLILMAKAQGYKIKLVRE